MHTGAGPPRRARQRHCHAVVPQSRLPPRQARAQGVATSWPASGPRRRASPSRRCPASPPVPTSTGTCSRLHDGATINRRVPRASATRLQRRQAPRADRCAIRCGRQPHPGRAIVPTGTAATTASSSVAPRTKIDMQPGDRQPGGHSEIVTERTEIAGQQNVRCGLRGERAVGQHQARPSPSRADRAPAPAHPSAPRRTRSRPVRS